MDKTAQQNVMTAEQLLASAQMQPVADETMAERLYKMFKKSDYVRIKNIDDKPSGWIFVDPEDELVERPDNVTRRVTPGKPQAVVLQPGEVKVIPGWQGYIALDRLWKEYAQRHSTNDRQSLNGDVAMQEFLDKSFLGIFDPNSVNEARPAEAKPGAATEPAKTKSKARDNADSDDLGFAEDDGKK